jgi:uncharacterized protein (DUF1800 family)
MPRFAIAVAASFIASVAVAQTATSSANAAARAAHALNRMTFGPRPGDVDRVLRMGLDHWIDQQLDPASIVDTAAARALAGFSPWTDSVRTVAAELSGPIVFQTESAATNGSSSGRMVSFVVIGTVLQSVTRDSARRAGNLGKVYLQNGKLLAGRLTRAEASDQQLLEVMTDFWENHFSLFGNKVPGRGTLVEWDRAVVRPNALGRFRDLLGAVAKSSAMLHYLDNALSTVDSAHTTLAEYTQSKAAGPPTTRRLRAGAGLNENFGRELLELHTLGVDGGYSQRDVIEVARAFTGWTHSQISAEGRTAFPRAGGPAPSFFFDSTKHDADAKTVLGVPLPPGRGIEDGEAVLDILARHPSTARMIARKLAVRFVSDAPPAALVDRAAATYLRTDGDIREVVRTIVTSPEFYSADAIGAKVKTPVELVLSMRRALSAPVDTAAEMMDLLIALEQPPFGRLTPEGWPEIGSAWLNVGAMKTRLEIASRVAQGDLPSIPVESWPAWKTLSVETFDKQADGVIEGILNGQVSARTRAALLSARPAGGDLAAAEARQTALRDLIALALSSPEFQRR